MEESLASLSEVSHAAHYHGSPPSPHRFLYQILLYRTHAGIILLFPAFIDISKYSHAASALSRCSYLTFQALHISLALYLLYFSRFINALYMFSLLSLFHYAVIQLLIILFLFFGHDADGWSHRVSILFYRFQTRYRYSAMVSISSDGRHARL